MKSCSILDSCSVKALEWFVELLSVNHKRENQGLFAKAPLHKFELLLLDPLIQATNSLASRFRGFG